MRVLSILTYYHPHWTGLTTIARRVTERLAARGHTMTVLTTRHDPSLATTETIRGVRVVRLTPAAFVSRGAILPTLPFRAASLMRDHDLVQIHTPLAEALVLAGLARMLGRPLLMTHYGDLVMPAGVFNRLVERSVVASMSGAAHLAEHVVTLSEDYARESAFLRPFAAKLRAIVPPVDIPLPSLEAVASWRHTLGLSGRPIVGFAGRFVEEKGFDFLLRAIPAIAAERPDVHFVYAGEHRVVYERFFDRCSSLIDAHKDRMTFVGLLLDQQRLADFYAMCDVFALPSRTDCFASVQVEAMLCGTPVVASDIPGAREAVTRTGMGRLARAGDPDDLARAILEVLRNRDRFVRSRGEVHSLYDGDRSADEYERLMSSLAAKR